MLSRFVGQLLPDAIDSLGILPADWDRWPPRAAPFQRRVTQSRWMSKGKDDHFEWMSEEPDRSAAVARQREMMDRADRALRESPLFQALRAGDLVIEAKRRDDRARYSEAEILGLEVWQFERRVIVRSPPLLLQRVGKGEWAYFANPIVRLSQRTTAETAAQQEGPRSRTKAPRKEPAYKIMLRKKFELVRAGKINRGMREGEQFALVLKALEMGDEKQGFGIDTFAKYVADKWPSDSDF
jgi:hypothetical protein